uniref:Uncharacterized protein n=1 Tax=Thermosphaera aggregans TaxID=54254 RepID=A0A7C2BK46_9CREN
MREAFKIILILTLITASILPLTAGTQVGNQSSNVVESLGLEIPIDDALFASYTIEPNLVYYNGRYYTSILNVTQGAFIEGNITFFIIDPSTGQVEKNVLTDNLGIDNFLVLAGDSIGLAYTRFSNTTYYRDLSLFLLDPATGSVQADVPVAFTSRTYDEHPVVAYNPMSNLLGIAHFMSNSTYRSFALSIVDLSTQTVVKTYLIPR